MAAEPDASLNPIEALKHIRTLIEAASDQVHGTPAEATFREIRAILVKAFPPKGRRKAMKP